jgi:hypothetical protein
MMDEMITDISSEALAKGDRNTRMIAEDCRGLIYQTMNSLKIRNPKHKTPVSVRGQNKSEIQNTNVQNNHLEHLNINKFDIVSGFDIQNSDSFFSDQEQGMMNHVPTAKNLFPIQGLTPEPRISGNQRLGNQDIWLSGFPDSIHRLLFFSSVVFFFLLIAYSTTCSAGSQGPLNPATVVDGDRGGALPAWSNMTNIYLSDDSRATVVVNTTGTVNPSDYMYVTNLSFSIPSDATITGIQVDIERYGTSIQDDTLTLWKNGAAYGNNKAATGTTWPTTSGTEAYVSYGGSADLWGGTWTVADINASNFGLQFAVKTGLATNQTAYVDHIRITVYFSGGYGAMFALFD